ncbi:MAG: hypothetical protein ACE5IR_20470, partial [bacterium]
KEDKMSLRGAQRRSNLPLLGTKLRRLLRYARNDMTIWGQLVTMVQPLIAIHSILENSTFCNATKSPKIRFLAKPQRNIGEIAR